MRSRGRGTLGPSWRGAGRACWNSRRSRGKVAQARSRRGLDRTSFYDWKRRFQTQGFEGRSPSTSTSTTTVSGRGSTAGWRWRPRTPGGRWRSPPSRRSCWKSSIPAFASAVSRVRRPAGCSQPHILWGRSRRRRQGPSARGRGRLRLSPSPSNRRPWRRRTTKSRRSTAPSTCRSPQSCPSSVGNSAGPSATLASSTSTSTASSAAEPGSGRRPRRRKGPVHVQPHRPREARMPSSDATR